MMWARRFWLRLQGLFRRDWKAQRLDDEIQFHLEQQIAENIAARMSPEEARYVAMRSFGNPTFFKEETRDTWGWTWLEQIAQDLRYGLRTLRKSPGFTTVAILTLALGIGANTAIFTMTNGLILRTLPVRDPGQLVEILHREPGDPEPGFNGWPWEAYQIMRDGNHVFSDLIVAGMNFVPVRADKLQPQNVFVGGVGGTFFQALGVRPAAGRLIGPDDVYVGSHALVAVVSWSFWKSRFDLDPAIIGKKIVVGGDAPLTIIGVTQRGFYGLSEAAPQDVWFPISLGPGFYGLLGRLKPGVSIEQARVEMAVLFQTIVNARSVDPFLRRMKLRVEPAGNGVATPLTQML